VFALLALCVTALIGCGGANTVWVPIRYLAPLDGRYPLDLETNRCAHTCYDNARGDGNRFYRCLATCPNIDVDEEMTCEDPTPEPPVAFCYTRWKEEVVPDPPSEDSSGDDDGGESFANFLGAIIGTVIESATDSGSCSSCRSEGHAGHASNEHEDRPRREVTHEAKPESRREPSSREYKEAKPRKSDD
jgi:hypothetical protein